MTRPGLGVRRTVQYMRRFGKQSIAAGIGAALAAGAARAADIHVYPKAEHITFITVQGEFKLADGDAFAAAAKTAEASGHGAVAVVFNSPGGALIAGLQMGQLIRLHRYATFSPDDAMCASACALAWLAGTPRMMQAGSSIGFHAAFVINGAAKSETGLGNALVGAYMTKLGLSFEAVAWAERAHPDEELSWLTPQDARELGIPVAIIPPFKHKDRPQTATSEPEQPDPVPTLLMPDQPAPTPETAPDERARHFADDYFAHWSEQNRDAIGYFGTAYAQTVTYYGKSIDHDTLLQSKRGYAERWPVRVYNPRPASIHTFCNPAGTVCTVSGIVDWDCRNPAGNAASTGSANFSLTVSLADGREQVLAESGSVISRGGN